MESSRSAKAGVMIKPLMLEAGLALALSVAGYLCAKILIKRASPRLNSATSADTQNGDRSYHGLEEEFSVLRDQLEDLRNRDLESEARFLQYQEVKEKESRALETMNELLIEKRHVEFLAREVSLMEEEKGLVLEYLRVLKLLEALKKENGLLRMKARKLLTRVKEGLCVIEEQKLRIEARDEEIVRNQREIESRGVAIEELENEIGLLKSGLDQLQMEKIELLNRIEVAETLASSRQKVEDSNTLKEGYDNPVKQLEQQQKDRAAEEKEPAHELVGCDEKHEQILIETNRPLEMEFDGNNEPRNSDHDCDGSCSANSGSCLRKGCPKRKKFLKKLRKWVEGGKADEKMKKELKCFGRDFVADEVEEEYVQGRKSL